MCRAGCTPLHLHGPEANLGSSSAAVTSSPFVLRFYWKRAQLHAHFSLQDEWGIWRATEVIWGHGMRSRHLYRSLQAVPAPEGHREVPGWVSTDHWWNLHSAEVSFTWTLNTLYYFSRTRRQRLPFPLFSRKSRGLKMAGIEIWQFHLKWRLIRLAFLPDFSTWRVLF